jgi:hypothetical protein
MSRAKVIVGAGVILYVNGKPYGRVSAFSFSSSTSRKSQYGLDSLEPFELSPTVTKISGQISLYRTIGDAGAEGASMTVSYEELPREKYFSVQLVERLSDTTIFDARYCSLESQTWSVSQHGIMTGQIEFEALDFNNELRPKG